MLAWRVWVAMFVFDTWMQRDKTQKRGAWAFFLNNQTGLVWTKLTHICPPTDINKNYMVSMVLNKIVWTLNSFLTACQPPLVGMTLSWRAAFGHRQTNKTLPGTTAIQLIFKLVAAHRRMCACAAVTQVGYYGTEAKDINVRLTEPNNVVRGRSERSGTEGYP